MFVISFESEINPATKDPCIPFYIVPNITSYLVYLQKAIGCCPTSSNVTKYNGDASFYL